MNPILLVIGTRPDAIKLIPLYLELKKYNAPVVLCSTFQHGDMLRQVLNIFGVAPDISLDIMRPNQDLFYVTQAVLGEMKKVFESVNPSLVVVQGDTTTAMASALAAFYLKIPVAHVESGIRTFDNFCPFPEEVNRKIIATVSRYNFAATKDNVRNLIHEGVLSSTIYESGNTVTDALRIIREKIDSGELVVDSSLISKIKEARDNNKKIVLFTAHRRESFGQGISKIFDHMSEFLDSNPDVLVFYPLHPNPNVKNVFYASKLSSRPNLVLFDPPLDYVSMVHMLSSVDAVVTDSGGLQEESATLGKFCVVIRERTDRPESSLAGFAEVVGYNKRLLFEALYKALNTNQQLATPQNLITHQKIKNIYGNGYASGIIAKIILDQYPTLIKKSSPNPQIFR